MIDAVLSPELDIFTRSFTGIYAGREPTKPTKLSQATHKKYLMSLKL